MGDLTRARDSLFDLVTTRSSMGREWSQPGPPSQSVQSSMSFKSYEKKRQETAFGRKNQTNRQSSPKYDRPANRLESSPPGEPTGTDRRLVRWSRRNQNQPPAETSGH